MPRYPYFNVDFCERNAHTRRLASVELTQAHPNNSMNVKKICSGFQDIFLNSISIMDSVYRGER